MDDHADKIAGVILGTAVGDALGLPYEGLSRRRQQKWLGKRPLAHRFLFGRGMVSDDTEHTCMVGQALLIAPDDADGFARACGWRLRFWLLSLPAGIGRATLRATVKLCLGFPPRYSGVWSAGNGPAMRAALLGICLGDDPEKLRAYVRASTRITHTDPRAERGALLITLAAWHGATVGSQSIDAKTALAAIRAQLLELDGELKQILDLLDKHFQRQSTAVEVAADLGLQHGVSGYIYHTVPMALYCWLRNPGDFRRAVDEVIRLGGDVDTTGAIVGGLAGGTVGARGIPVEWIDGLTDWPLTVSWMRSLAARLAEQFASPKSGLVVKPMQFFWLGRFVRNLFFVSVVLVHAMRRLLPPY